MSQYIKNVIALYAILFKKLQNKREIFEEYNSCFQENHIQPFGGYDWSRTNLTEVTLSIATFYFQYF